MLDLRALAGARRLAVTPALALGLLLSPGLVATGCGDDGESEPSCAVEAGQCPNICDPGTGVEGEVCAGTADCGCGLFCDGASGSCQPYTGANAGCSCDADSPPAPDASGGGDDTGGGGGGDDTGGGGGGGGGPDINDGCTKNAPNGASCNPYCNIGCEAGEHCAFDGNNFSCTVSGAGAIGEACQGSNQCGEGMSCFGLQGDPAGNTCKQACIGDGDCPDGRRCTLNVNFSSIGEAASFCGDVEVGCNAFEVPSSACGEGEGCYLSQGATKCFSAGELTEGEVCEGANACTPGLQCLVTCQAPCSTDGSASPACADCASGASNTISDGNALGVCLTESIPAACDIFAQTGCEAGDGCYPVQGGHGCVPAGDQPAGTECTSTNQCVPGTLCISNICLPYCRDSADTPADHQCASKCDSAINFNPTIWQQGVCTDVAPANPCDFWQQDCTGGKVCYPTLIGEMCQDPLGSTPEGGACQRDTDCAQGLVCPGNGPNADACTTPCSIDEFVEAPGVLICADDCASDFTPLYTGSLVGTCN